MKTPFTFSESNHGSRFLILIIRHSSSLGPKKRKKRKRKGECARGSFPFQICIRVCCMEKPSKRGREEDRRWLNRAAAASVCVLKNGDYDLGAEYFDLSFFQNCEQKDVH